MISVDTSIFIAILVILSGIGVSIFGWVILKVIALSEQTAVTAVKVSELVELVDELHQLRPANSQAFRNESRRRANY